MLRPAAEYRGSTGYGKAHYQKIDYGGLEVADAMSSQAFMLNNCEFVDPNRVGIIGWSHGGLSFNRMDTKTAREIRLEIYRFLDQYLSPPRAFKSVRELEREAYKFKTTD